MRIHRSKHSAGFTVLPNSCLRDRRLSFTARGLLSYLLSHPESTRQDIKTLSAGNPEGQEAVARAMRELIAHGYLTREHVRNAAGRISTVVDVYDTPQDSRQGVKEQVRPHLGLPRPGEPDPGEPSALPTGVKKEEKETTPSARGCVAREPARPARPPTGDGENGSTAPGSASRLTAPGSVPESVAPGFVSGSTLPGPVPESVAPGVVPGAVSVAPDSVYGSPLPGSVTGSAVPGVAFLVRLGRAEPRLTVGESEMAAVLPLLAEWLARGGTEAQIRTVLTVGLPDEVRSPAKLIVHRLRSRMPAPAVVSTAPRPVTRAECDECGRPVTSPGVCARCGGPPRGVPVPTADVERGAALARSLLRTRRPVAAQGRETTGLRRPVPPAREAGAGPGRGSQGVRKRLIRSTWGARRSSWCSPWISCTVRSETVCRHPASWTARSRGGCSPLASSVTRPWNQPAR